MKSNADYLAALNRLVAGNPVRQPKGSPINKDTVALEAGRSRGSIKKSRLAHKELIQKIAEAALAAKVNKPSNKTLLAEARSKASHYRNLYHSMLAKELMYIEQLAEYEQRLKNTSNVVELKQK